MTQNDTILFITLDDSQETLCSQLSEALGKEGVKVESLSLSAGAGALLDRLERGGVPVVFKPATGSRR